MTWIARNGTEENGGVEATGMPDLGSPLNQPAIHDAPWVRLVNWLVPVAGRIAVEPSRVLLLPWVP